MRRRFVIELEDGDDGPASTYQLGTDIMAAIDAHGWVSSECFREEPVGAEPEAVERDK